MSQQIIDIGAAANDGTGEPLRSAFNAVNENFSEVYAAGPVGSNVTISGNTITVTGINNNLVLAANGIGNIQANSTIMPSIDAVYDIGSPSNRIDTVYSAYFVGNGSQLTGVISTNISNSIVDGDSNVTIPETNGNVVINVDGREVAQVQRLNTILNANLIPGANTTYDLGSPTAAWQDLYLSNSTIYLANSTIQSNSTAFTLTTPTGGAITLQGNGIITPYANSNVAAYLPTYTGNVRAGNVSATGNVTGQYIIGDGGFLSNIVFSGNVAVSQLGNGTTVLKVENAGGNLTSTIGGVSNVQVTTPTGINVTGTVSATGNITGSYILGNGSQLSGLPDAYSNAKVAAYLPTYTGNIGANSISAAGNVTGSYFVGNGSALRSINGANVSGTVALATSAGTVTTAAQPNITSVGTLNSVNVTANITGGNIISTGLISAAGQVIGSQFNGSGAGLTNISGANVSGTVASATTAATVTTAAQPNITSVGTLTSLSSSGNISGAYILGNGSQLSAISGANVTGQVGNALVAGTVYTAAQPNITSVGTLSSLSVSGNVGAGNINGNGSGLSSITGANVTGQVANALVAGTVYTAAQPNITSVGTLSSLTTAGNVIVGGDLVVNGNTTQVNIEQLNVQDPIIGLGRGPNNEPLTSNDGKDRGTEMWYYTTAEKSAFVGYQNSTGNIIAASNISIANEIITVNSYGNFVTGNVIGATFSASGNVLGNYILGNGSQLTGLPESYTNANVAAYLPTYTGNLVSLQGNVTTTANVSGNFFIGNGSQLTGLPEGYANANVEAYLPTYTGNLASLTGAVTTTANISGNYILGNGSQLTGLPEGYANANVEAYLPTYPGNLVSLTGAVTTTANISGNFFIGNGSQLTGMYSNTDVAAYLPTYTGNLASLTGNVTTTANISGNYILGNGSQLTGLPEGYANANVEAYLPTYTGNLASLTGNVTTTANISGNFFIGNGSQLTGMYSNTDVAAYLPTYTGNLASLTGNVTTTANVSGGNISTSGLITATGNVTGSNIIASGLVSANTLSIANTASIGGNLNMNSRNITSLANPVNAQDAVTKTYVDTLVASGIHFHDPVRVESPINLTATYNNGTAGVGATLTNSGTQAALIIDGITMVVADRVLVYEQTDETQNGIYVVSDVGSVSTNWVLTRAGDADTYVINSADGLSEGSTVFVQQGATGAGELYTCNTAGVITFGTTNITFAQISTAQIYSAGTGLTLTGTQFSIANTAVTLGSYGSGDQVATFTVNGQGQLTAAANTAITANAANLTGTVLNSSIVTSSLTSVGTLSSLSVTGNVDAGNVNGNGSGLTNITAANVTGQVANALVAGTVYTNAQPNITSVGTLSSLSVTGNVDGGNINGNGSGLSSLTGANVTGQVANALIAGTVYTNAQPNITSVGTLSSLSVTGNVDGGNIITSGLISATGKLDVGGQITTTRAGNAATNGGQIFLNGLTNNRIDWNTEGTGAPEYTTRSAGAKAVLYPSISGSATDYALGVEAGALWSGIPGNDGGQFFKWYGGNVLVASLSGTGVFSAAGNVTGSNINGNGSGLSSITGANVTGQVANALIAGTVYTNAQPNITSVGTLSSLSVTGNIAGNILIGNTAVIPVITVNQLKSDDSSFVSVEDGLDVQGEILATGNIAGSYFIGNGSQLTGVAVSQLINGTKTFDLAANGIVSMPVSASFFDANQEYLAADVHALDEFDITQYRTAKYIVQATRINVENSTSQVHSTEVLLTHNGVNTFMTEYATLITSNALITLDSYIANGNAVLEATTLAANTTMDLFRVTLVPGPIVPSLNLEGDLMTETGTEDLNVGVGAEDLNN
jgi:hypothetical protein